jgi:hypothetical protein
MYLIQILQKYQPRNLSSYYLEINYLHNILKKWASTCYIEIINSGSMAKGTAISVASDVDYLISLASNCNENSGGLRGIYDSLYSELVKYSYRVTKQNVSFRINLNGLKVDVTPARKHSGNTNDHSLYVSKKQTWQQTNVKRHITDISQSGRTNEIKILKIWRELNRLEFPSIYLEYLLVDNILFGKSKEQNSLGENVLYVLKQLAKTQNNPLFIQIVDPANSNNILSDLLSNFEKNQIISRAQLAIRQSNWDQIVS